MGNRPSLVLVKPRTDWRRQEDRRLHAKKAA